MVLVCNLGEVVGRGAEPAHVLSACIAEHLGGDGGSSNPKRVVHHLHVVVHGVGPVGELGGGVKWEGLREVQFSTAAFSPWVSATPSPSSRTPGQAHTRTHLGERHTVTAYLCNPSPSPSYRLPLPLLPPAPPPPHLPPPAAWL